jgi:tRNA-Thr(GGU) m(6)t(6)A37 methyltransferase TsaA
MPKIISFKPIGVIRSRHCDPAKTPIQPVFAKGCRGRAEIYSQYAKGLSDLEGFSHVYLVYHFHKAGPFKLMVKPFLDDAERGVFATRAPRRPNPIGFSLVTLVKRKGRILYLDGLDVLDGTPLLDIKPFIGRFDVRSRTRRGWQARIDDATAFKKGARK